MLDQKRISDGWFTYIHLDLNKRWGYELKLDGSEFEVDNAILNNCNKYKTYFRNHWSKHKCEEKGCGEVLVCDGGMKPHRWILHIF